MEPAKSRPGGRGPAERPRVTAAAIQTPTLTLFGSGWELTSADGVCDRDHDAKSEPPHTTVQRIWAGTEVDNLVEQRALEKAGFTREGIARAAGWRDGAWRDGVIYSLLRTDPAV